MKIIIILALAIRLILAPLAAHEDSTQYYWWSKDIFQNGLLGFYDRDIANATRPNYPPVTSYFFYLNAILHEVILKVFWLLNLIPFFPSNLIFWLESEKGWFFINKIIPILSDLGIIYILFKFAQKLDQKSALIPPTLFAFLPAFFYNSAVWGQTDSIVILFMLAAFYVLFYGKLLLSLLFYLLALLAKPLAFFASPIYIAYWITKSNLATTFKAILLAISIIFLLYLPFHPDNLITWLINFYGNSLGGKLDYLVANAFNLWALIFGFDNQADTTPIFGIPAYIIGNFLFILTAIISVLLIFFNKKARRIEVVLLLAATVSFAAFLFLPRMHERYFYPSLILLLPLAGKNIRVRYLAIILSLIHFINLYHFWWVPKVDFLVILLTNPVLINSLIVINILAFGFLLKEIYNQVKIETT